MQSTELEVLQQSLRWLEQGHPVVLFTVVKTWGSAPRPIGSLLAVRADGQLVGSLSGGCVEADIRERVIAGEFQSAGELEYGVNKADSERFGLPCGGVLRIVQEPLQHPRVLQPAVQALQHRQLVGRKLQLASGKVSWFDATHDQALYYDEQYLRCVYGPRWRLLIIGAGQASQYLAEFALALNYQVITCDPRSEYAQMWQVNGTQLDTRMPDDAVRELAQDSRSAVVALTHDPKLDDMALMEALLSPAFYVGALGSKNNNAKRIKRLASLDIPSHALLKLRAPVGLPIGSRTPPEIAISVLAEMTAIRNGAEIELPVMTTQDWESSSPAAWQRL